MPPADHRRVGGTVTKRQALVVRSRRGDGYTASVVFIDRGTGECRHADDSPGATWTRVHGRGALLRRREPTGFTAAFMFEPDIPLWAARGWERVRFVRALPIRRSVRGARSALRIEIADRGVRDPTSLQDAPELSARARRSPPATGPVDRSSVWVCLPDEPGRETAAERPGAQAVFSISDLRTGANAAQIAAGLLTSRILAAEIPLERALWVLTGPPVSPEDSSILRKLRSVIALAERLSEDLRTAMRGYVPGTDDASEPPPRRAASAAKPAKSPTAKRAPGKRPAP